MEADIKCALCGKGTRRHELGEIFYLAENASSSVIIKDPIICPKCSKDISDGQCMVKANDLLMKFVTANICTNIGDLPHHLKGAYPLAKKDYNLVKDRCAGSLNLVEKF